MGENKKAAYGRTYDNVPTKYYFGNLGVQLLSLF